jgi:hypothetical protein
VLHREQNLDRDPIGRQRLHRAVRKGVAAVSPRHGGSPASDDDAPRSGNARTRVGPSRAHVPAGMGGEVDRRERQQKRRGEHLHAVRTRGLGLEVRR